MAYKPTAEDFEDIDDGQGYLPSAEDFEEQGFSDESEKDIKGWKGLGHDAIEMIRSALKGGLGFARRAPGNIAEIKSEFLKNPLSYPPHVAQQILAGGAEGIRDVANIPHRIFDELADKGITPNWLRTGSIPEDLGIEKALGLEPTNKSDELLRALPGLYGGGNLLTGGIKSGAKKFKAPDLRQALKDTQKKVNDINKSIGKTFDKIETEVDARKLNNISIKKSLIEDAARLLDKSPETKEMIAKAKSGDYKALRDLQADLRVIGENSLSNKLSTERNVGKQAISVRDRINKGIEDHLEKNGSQDLAKELAEARKKYKHINDVYYATPQLTKVFGKSQRIPKKPATLLTEDSAEMAKFFEAHPEVKAITDKFVEHADKMKKLKWALNILGGGGAAGITYKLLD